MDGGKFRRSWRQGIEEHYLPRTAALELPKTQVGRLAALADKFDSLVGGFAAGLAPTGNKDPYALRRAALGVIAIVRGGRLFRSGPELRAIILKAREFYRQQDMLLETGDELAQRLLGFFRDRLEIALVEELRAREAAGGEGVPADALAGKVGVVNVVRAVLAAGFGNLAELDARLAAVAAFAERSDFARLCTVVERARNIVRKTAQFANRVEPEEAALVATEERELHRIYAGVAPRFRLMLAEGDLAGASELYLKSFAAPLHLFFEKVFVNVEDDVLRRNRLALLAAIYRLYAEAIADLAECAGQAKA